MTKLLMIVGMVLAAAMAPVGAAEPPATAKFVVHEWGVQIRSVVPVLYETPTLILKTMGEMKMKVVDDPNAKPRSVQAPPGQLISDLSNFSASCGRSESSCPRF